MKEFIRRSEKTLRGLSRVGLVILTILSMQMGTVYAVDVNDLQSINNATPWYNPNFLNCALAQNAGTVTDVSEIQAGNAKIIMGIAKTENLGQEGALIGLMTGIVESHLTNKGNPTVPVSIDNPARQGDLITYDLDSVGVFQQRPSAGWSTIASGPGAVSNKDAVWQLMNVAYAAEAFFGSPPGSNAPPALSKGLQNRVPNYKTADPGTAAQTVQVSAFPDRYNKVKDQAQSLLTKYWEDSPPIPLPVPFSGGQSGGGGSDNSSACGGSAVIGDLVQTIENYAWPEFHPAGFINMRPAYASAVAAAAANREYVGGLLYRGIDCGGFITRVMRDSKIDPQYNAYNGPVNQQEKYMKDHPEKYQLVPNVRSTNDLKPGDIAIQNDQQHTYMYVGSIPGFKGNAVSASLDERAPMADNAYSFTNFRWYRLIKK